MTPRSAYFTRLGSRRAQAAITAGVLAFTSVAPAAAFATDGDDEVEGAAPPVQVETDLGDDTGFEVEGDADATPDAAGSVPGTAGPPAASAAPATSVPEVAPSVEDAPEPEAAEEPEDVAGDPAVVVPDPAPESAAPPVAQAPVAAPPEQAPAPSTGATKVKRAERSTPKQRRVVRVRSVTAPAPTSATPRAATPKAATPNAAAPQAPPAAARIVVAAPSHPARPGDTTHVVERGESLWSIASDMLGGDASPARIAREVHRLWELNETRIGTGNRDLLLVGTRLELQ